DHPETLDGVLDAGGDEFIAKPMSPEDLRARLIVARRRMSQDAARRNTEEELSKARWLAGIGDATLALQHEINNPLSALLGNAELMIMELDEQGQKNEMLNVIHEQALRIADVVKRLRRLKNPESVDYVGGSRMINLWKEHVSGLTTSALTRSTTAEFTWPLVQRERRGGESRRTPRRSR